jgi:hypothetical protein
MMSEVRGEKKTYQALPRKVLDTVVAVREDLNDQRLSFVVSKITPWIGVLAHVHIGKWRHQLPELGPSAFREVV